MTEAIFKERGKVIQKRLKSISNRKYQIFWAIFVTLFGPFIMPFMPLRRMQGTFGEMLGYWNTVLLFSGIMLPIMSYLIYKEYDKMVRDKFDTESELRLLKKELNQKQ